MNEAEMLRIISSTFSLGPDADLLVGIGDDAAVVAGTTRKRLYATDMAVEGSHFRRDWSELGEIGAKIVAANLADIYAMGGVPKYLLVAAGIPATFSADELQRLASGIQGEALLVGARIIGGDLTRSHELTLSITVIGEVESPVLRSTAKPGDEIVLSALTGYSALGYELLKRGIKDARSTHHRKPVVHYSEISELSHDDRSRFTSLIDTSDGLISEANHLSEASGVQLAIERDLLADMPGFSELDFLARNEHMDLWSLILHGGEDHRFLGTVRGEIPQGFFRIGTVREGVGVSVDGEIARHEGFDQFNA